MTPDLLKQELQRIQGTAKMVRNTDNFAAKKVLINEIVRLTNGLLKKLTNDENLPDEQPELFVQNYADQLLSVNDEFKVLFLSLEPEIHIAKLAKENQQLFDQYLQAIYAVAHKANPDDAAEAAVEAEDDEPLEVHGELPRQRAAHGEEPEEQEDPVDPVEPEANLRDNVLNKQRRQLLNRNPLVATTRGTTTKPFKEFIADLTTLARDTSYLGDNLEKVNEKLYYLNISEGTDEVKRAVQIEKKDDAIDLKAVSSEPSQNEILAFADAIQATGTTAPLIDQGNVLDVAKLINELRRRDIEPVVTQRILDKLTTDEVVNIDPPPQLPQGERNAPPLQVEVERPQNRGRLE